MSEETPELVAKKRLVVNEESYYSAPRTWSGDSLFYQRTINNGSYFHAPSADKLRIAIGKNWDIFKKEEDGVLVSPPAASFSNDHGEVDNHAAKKAFIGSVKLFEGKPLKCRSCADEIVSDSSPEMFTFMDCVTEEGYLLETDNHFGYAGTRREENWAKYVKTGMITTQGNDQYEPIVKANKWYFDHHFHGISPFTPRELENKQTYGKAFTADCKTFYNERLKSEDFEALVGSNPNLQNSLPSIYSFLKLFVNKEISEKTVINLHSVLKDAKEYYQREDVENYDIYKVLLKKDALEVLLTLYGVIGESKISESESVEPLKGLGADKKNKTVDSTNTGANKKDPFFQPKGSNVIEKILTTSFDNPAIDHLSYFETYFNEYTDLVSKNEKLQFSDTSDNNRILALERMMTNLVFSPSVLSILKLTEKYKKYFPYYAELEFTANLQTAIGDALKDMFLTKTVSEMILASPQYFNSNDSWLVGLGTLLSEDTDLLGLQDPYFERKYVEYSNETVYEDITQSSVVQESGEIKNPVNKKSINLPVALEYWLGKDTFSGGTNFVATFIAGGGYEPEGIYSDEQKTTTAGGFSTQDLRNYLTYFRDDFVEPININDDDNEIFKKLFGTALYAKIFNVYKANRRKYEDIIDGKPAYTEDLFYRIEKTLRTDDQPEERVVQNILIPNTTELDIVNYVDTQLKYSNAASKNATYKYNVYAHKIVFGSRYKYVWTDEDGNKDEAPVQKVEQEVNLTDDDGNLYERGIMVNVNDPHAGTELAGKMIYYTPQAYFKVIVAPSVVLVEDKIFSTPDVIILDKPPVMPDIDIIPYRGINNRVKFLMTGATGRYRMKPVMMLESDEAEFDKISRAQMSSDGKVEFGSDDAAKSFQIFRTTDKPRAYTDFELYDQITNGVYEEMVQPNKKYYYTFRVVDKHGHVSNPTAVYEVELIDEKGAVKPIIRTVDITPVPNKKNTKGCQKYIYLKPTLKQLYFSDSSEVDSLFSNQVNKKRYKMRLTSKSSGKKIDIDFSFEKKFITE